MANIFVLYPFIFLTLCILLIFRNLYWKEIHWQVLVVISWNLALSIDALAVLHFGFKCATEIKIYILSLDSFRFFLLLNVFNHFTLLKPSDGAPTLSLCSFLLTITAVICWSMNIRMVTTTAGSAAARYTHQGFPPKGGTNQPLSGLVGYGEKKLKKRLLKTLETDYPSPDIISKRLQIWNYRCIVTWQKNSELRLCDQTKVALFLQFKVATRRASLCSHIPYNQALCPPGCATKKSIMLGFGRITQAFLPKHHSL